MTGDLFWFPFHVDRWQNSQSVKLMSYAQRGVYLELLSYAWRDGHIPASVDDLALILSISADEMEKIWHRVGRCFNTDSELREFWESENLSGEPPMIPAGRLCNPWLEQVRANANTRRAKVSAARKKAADTRWAESQKANNAADAKPKRKAVNKGVQRPPDTGAFAIAERVMKSVNLSMGWGEPTRADIVRHLKPESPIQALVTEFGEDIAAGLFLSAAKNWGDRRPTWPAVFAQRYQIRDSMIGTQSNNDRESIRRAVVGE